MFLRPFCHFLGREYMCPVIPRSETGTLPPRAPSYKP